MTILMSGDHGTYSMYARKGCRCDDCREYQRARVAKNRADRLASNRLNHGSRSSYDAGCRCKLCRETRTNAAKGEYVSLRHNHVTRDIKPYGQCPVCDDYWAGVR